MNNSSKFAVEYFLGDTIILSITILLSIYINKGPGFENSDWILISVLIVLWFIIVYWRKLYFYNFYKDHGKRQVNFLKSCTILILLCVAFYFLFTFPKDFRNVVILFSIGFPLLGITTNFIIISISNRLDKKSNPVKEALVAGTGGAASMINDYYGSRPKLGYKINGFIKYKKEDCEVEEGRIVGDLKYMKEYLNNSDVDEIFIPVSIKEPKKIKEIIDLADYLGKRVKLVPDYQSVFGNGYKVVHQTEMDIINARQMPLDERKAYLLKECFDWCFASIVLMLLAPVFLCIAILIKLESPQPVFYCPVRVGKGGKPIRIYKFRTMNESDSPLGGKSSTKKDDPRITKLGRFLRKYSLDELPQFINVFLGEMSVVGPRPHRIYLNEQFQKAEKKYMIRHYFKPGITGWAQVNGWRGPTESYEQKHQRTMHDLWYLENWSFKLDLKIIYMTLFGKKTKKNAY